MKIVGKWAMTKCYKYQPFHRQYQGWPLCAALILIFVSIYSIIFDAYFNILTAQYRFEIISKNTQINWIQILNQLKSN